MTELSQPEINIEELKSSIRQAVERREAEGRTSFIKASAELFDLLAADDLGLSTLSSCETPARTELSLRPAEVSPLRLQPEFVPRSDDHYHVSDLLRYHDHQFVWNTYRALLKREPDEDGLRVYLGKLRTGRFNKIDVLAALRFSPEGRRHQVRIDGLRLPAMIRRLYRLPALGYLIELTVGLVRLPALIRNQRQVEGYLIAQQERIVDHTNIVNQAFADLTNTVNQAFANHINAMGRNLSEANTQLGEAFSRSFTELVAEQKRIAYLQHQQVAALFRDQQKTVKVLGSLNGRKDGSIGKGRLSEQDRPARTSERQSDLDELYAAFQKRFRGDAKEVKENLKTYLPLLREAGITGDILDLGCGCGEWLELLRDEGLQARGVESNRTMIADGRTRNLEIIEADAVAYLRSLPENRLYAITAFHFIEHIGLEQLIELLEETRRVLRPGGVVILETPNPKNLVVGACNFYSDPTHRQPLFPESLQFVLEHLGFVRTHLQYLHPVEGSPFTGRDEASQALDSWFFSARDFVVIGWKA